MTPALEESVIKGIPHELLDELLADSERPEDPAGPDGLLKRLFGRLLETAAGFELADHLGHTKERSVGAWFGELAYDAAQRRC